jgi:SAM-dependent methyltransferase
LSGFSADWLALREPADHKARDAALAHRLAEHLAGRETVRILDLGCGTGSNLRALAPTLPCAQAWTLIDYDPALLAVARQRIDAWRREAGQETVAVEYQTADLQTGLDDVLAGAHDIVTASALFDLVSAEWIERFVAAVAGRRSLFYTVLIYDGHMGWSPPHPHDRAITAAFNAHQHHDKGFGPAAGPDAGGLLAEHFERAGYQVATATSPWRLTRAEWPLMTATAEGIAEAAGQIGTLSPGELDDWRVMRGDLIGCEVGHVDLLAIPPA